MQNEITPITQTRITPKHRWDDNALAPVIVGVIWLIGIAIAGAIVIGVYQFTQKPDVTYNITDTGFSLAGIDTGAIYVIAGAIAVLGFFWYLSKKK